MPQRGALEHRPSSSDRFQMAAAAAVVIATASLWGSPFGNVHVTTIIQSLSTSTSLSSDPLVVALLHAPYSASYALLARAFAAISETTGLPGDWLIFALQTALWALQAVLVYRWTQVVSGNQRAGLIGAALYGLQVALVPRDVSVNPAYLERTLCMAPLLWALLAQARGRYMTAVLANAFGAYLHATPCVYLFPVLFLEDALAARRQRLSWRGPAARLLTGCLAMLPLALKITGANALDALKTDYLLLSVATNVSGASGRYIAAADLLFMLEGVLLLGVCAWRAAPRPQWRFWLGSAALLALLAAFGTLAQALYDCSRAGVWLTVTRIQLWNGLALIGLLGLPFLAAWIEGRMREKSLAWPAFLTILALPAAGGLDWILRAAAIAAAGLENLGRRAAAALVVALAASAGLFYSAAPKIMEAAARWTGLRGGLFELPVFQPKTAAVLLASLVLGWLVRRSSRSRAPSALALIIPIAAQLIFARPPSPWLRDSLALADWVRDNTEPESVVAFMPLDLLAETPFRARAQRAVFASILNADCISRFGALCAPMGERLEALGFEFSRVRALPDLPVEYGRISREFDPRKARRLAKEFGVTHLVLAADRPWPQPKLTQQGALALYRIRADGATRN